MFELVSDIWIYLPGAVLLGLLIGWALRGAFIPRPKKVSASAINSPLGDINWDDPSLGVKSERTETMLASVQSRLAEAEAATSRLKARLETSHETIAQLQSDLQEVQQVPENDAAGRSGQSLFVQQEAQSVPAPADEDTAYVPQRVDQVQAEAVLENRFLNSRIRLLENEVTSGTMVAGLPAEGLPDEGGGQNALIEELADVKAKLAIAEAKGLASVSAPNDQSAAARLDWQNKYLRARTSYFEEILARVSSVPAPVTEPASDVETETSSFEIDTLQSEITVLKAELARTSHGDSANEQELARLRWRNRYLEGRLKYLEAAALDAANDEDDSLLPSDQPVTSTLVDFPVRPAPPVVEEPVTPSEAILRVIEANEARPSFGALPDLEDEEEESGFDLPDELTADAEDEIVEVRPTSLDGPLNGQRDELTRIGGVGPKIEGILNELGIFHFEQIAAWTPGEESWIDSYLRFQGRVKREAWIDQAKSLARADSEQGA